MNAIKNTVKRNSHKQKGTLIGNYKPFGGRHSFGSQPVFYQPKRTKIKGYMK